MYTCRPINFNFSCLCLVRFSLSTGVGMFVQVGITFLSSLLCIYMYMCVKMHMIKVETLEATSTES